MKVYVIIFLKLIIFSIVSCHVKNSHKGFNEENLILSKSDSTQMFREAFTRIDSSFVIKDKTYVILPASGCPPCMEPAITFLKSNINNIDKYSFIVTEINRFDELADSFGNEIINNNNLLLDNNNYFGLSGFYSIYPQVVIIKNHNIKLYKQLDYNHLDLWKSL